MEEKFYELSEAELNELLEKAGEKGASKALAKVFLHDEDAQHDIKELRDLLKSFRQVRVTAFKTITQAITTGFIMLILLGIAAYFKLGLPLNNK